MKDETQKNNMNDEVILDFTQEEIHGTPEEQTNSGLVTNND